MDSTTVVKPQPPNDSMHRNEPRNESSHQVTYVDPQVEAAQVVGYRAGIGSVIHREE